MRLLLILHPDYSFPHPIDDFPLANTFFSWLKNDPQHRLMIIANTDIAEDVLRHNQIEYKRMYGKKRMRNLLYPFVFQLHIFKWVRTFRPTHILFDHTDTAVLFQSVTISALWMKRFQQLPAYIICKTDKALLETGHLLKDKKKFKFSGLIRANQFINEPEELRTSANIFSIYHRAAPVFYPRSDDEKEHIKYQLTKGCAYFLCSAAFQNKASLVLLLKAFSIFKKRFNNQFVLVLTGISADTLQFKSLIAGYKYRDDIIVLSDSLKRDFPMILAACYAHIFIAGEIYPYDISACFAAGVPAIADIAMYKPTEINLFLSNKEGDVQQLAENMMLIYKDESLRNEIIVTSAQYVKSLQPGVDNAKVFHTLLRNKDI